MIAPAPPPKNPSLGAEAALPERMTFHAVVPERERSRAAEQHSADTSHHRGGTSRHQPSEAYSMREVQRSDVGPDSTKRTDHSRPGEGSDGVGASTAPHLTYPPPRRRASLTDNVSEERAGSDAYRGRTSGPMTLASHLTISRRSTQPTPATLSSTLAGPESFIPAQSQARTDKSPPPTPADIPLKSPMLARLKHHLISREPLSRTWERASFVDECRSAPIGGRGIEGPADGEGEGGQVGQRLPQARDG